MKRVHYFASLCVLLFVMFSIMETNAQSVSRSKQDAGQGTLTPKSTASQTMQENRDGQVAPGTSPSIVPAAVKTATDMTGVHTQVSSRNPASMTELEKLMSEYKSLMTSNEPADKLKMEVVKQAMLNLKHSSN